MEVLVHGQHLAFAHNHVGLELKVEKENAIILSHKEKPQQIVQNLDRIAKQWLVTLLNVRKVRYFPEI